MSSVVQYSIASFIAPFKAEDLIFTFSWLLDTRMSLSEMLMSRPMTGELVKLLPDLPVGVEVYMRTSITQPNKVSASTPIV